MYRVSQREIGEYIDRMHLEVGMKFFSSYPESQCHLFEEGISGFCFEQGFAYKEYRPLLPILILFE